jgi:PhnB protein
MARKSVSEQLEERIDAVLAGGKTRGAAAGGKVEGLARVAEGLRGLPREEFRKRLKSELEGRTNMASAARTTIEGRQSAFMAPRLTFKDAAKAIEFYKTALGARETFRFEPGGHIAHAEMVIGDSVLMIAEEWPEGGRLSAETVGSSPIWLSIRVDNVDAFAQRATAAGMKVKRAIQDQFYGHRDVLLTDPFGYTWSIFTVKEEVSMEEMHRRLERLTVGPEGGAMPVAEAEIPSTPYIRKGFHTITPYLIVKGAAGLLKFIEEALGGKEMFRVQRPGTELLMHAEARVGNSMLEMADANEDFPPTPAGLHLYVPDADAVYEKALEAGATSLSGMTDQEYGERSGSVKDRFGNFWYIATAKGPSYVPEGHYSITPYLHPLRAPQFIEFVTKAFGAQEMFRAQSPDGVVHHAQVRIGDSLISMGEAHGIYQPMPTTLHMYVPNADAAFERALSAGAETIMPVKDQPYGERSGGVKDPFGNRWFIATHIRDVQP